MSSMSAVDPADVRAQARAELGLLRELVQPRRIEPHPRRGGLSGYSVWSQEEQLKNGTWGRRASLPRRPSIVGRAASSHIVIPAILHILQLQPQPPLFIFLPPIIAPAANTGVLFNHGVHEAAVTVGTAVATTTMRAATQQRQRDSSNVTAATQWQQPNGSNATAAGIDTGTINWFPPKFVTCLHPHTRGQHGLTFTMAS